MSIGCVVFSLSLSLFLSFSTDIEPIDRSLHIHASCWLMSFAVIRLTPTYRPSLGLVHIDCCCSFWWLIYQMWRGQRNENCFCWVKLHQFCLQWIGRYIFLWKWVPILNKLNILMCYKIASGLISLCCIWLLVKVLPIADKHCFIWSQA